MKVVCGIGLKLPAVRIQVLLKVAMFVQKANTTHWKSKVAGRFGVVSCKYSKTA